MSKTSQSMSYQEMVDLLLWLQKEVESIKYHLEAQYEEHYDEEDL